MNRVSLLFVFAAIVLSLLFVQGTFAQQGGAPPDLARNAFAMILSGADSNGDGKLSMEECMSMWKDRSKAEKNCRHWDANGDGIITEQEYVSKATRRAP